MLFDHILYKILFVGHNFDRRLTKQHPLPYSESEAKLQSTTQLNIITFGHRLCTNNLNESGNVIHCPGKNLDQDNQMYMYLPKNI